MELFFMGILLAISIIIILYKLDKGYYESAILDIVVSFGLMAIFSGTYIGLGVSVIAGIIISAYLYLFKPSFYRKVKEKILDEL